MASVYSYSPLPDRNTQLNLVIIIGSSQCFFGKGYASLVTKTQLKKIAEMGDNVYVGIFEHNIPSRSLFEKLGFKAIGEIHYILTKI